MEFDNLKRAQKIVTSLQEELISFRKEAYKTVHDDIGSNLSAISIKAKMLSEKLKDSYERKEMSEIHALIRETLEHATQLNKKLKISWVPQGTESFFNDIRKELEKIETKHNIRLSLEVVNDKTLKKLSFSTMALIYEWISTYIQHSIARLVESLTIQIEIFDNRLEWKFIDESPLLPDQKLLETLVQKTTEAKGSFSIKNQNKKHVALLTLTP